MQAFTVQDPHSYGNCHEVIPTHLSLDIRLDFDQQTIDASCELHLSWLDATADHVDLDTCNFTLNSVTDAQGQALRYEIGPRHAYMGNRLRIYTPEQQGTMKRTPSSRQKCGQIKIEGNVPFAIPAYTVAGV